MFKYREFLNLTDEEITFILTDIFNPAKIENIERNEKTNEITATITTYGWYIGGSVCELTDEVTLTMDEIHVDFSIDNDDMFRYKQFLLAKGCSNLLKNNPYLK